MMIKELLRVLTDKQSLLDEMQKEFVSMLEISREMYVMTTDNLCLGGSCKLVEKNLFPSDKKINQIEQLVRRQVVTHISIAGADNLASMLIFLAIVKDAERIGDNIKNLYTICNRIETFCEGSMGKEALRVRNGVIEYMHKLITVFDSQNARSAKKFVEDIKKYRVSCDNAIEKLIKDGNKIENAVIYTLFFRYNKRILSRMKNIALAIYMPVDKLDYFDAARKTRE